MAKHDKALAKLCATPTPSNVKWDELKAILLHLGYTMVTGSGSRRKFYNQEKNALIICHAPHSPECVDKGCVVDVVDHLKTHCFI